MAGPGTSGYHGFLYKDTQVMDLGVLLGGNWSEAFAIANDGTIVGWSGLTPQTAVVWRDSVISSLAALLGTANSKAQGISDDGSMITGWAGPSISSANAFICDGRTATLLPLPQAPGAFFSEGNGVNLHGDVVGRFVSTAGHACAWLDGKPIILPKLPGQSTSRANDINDDGVIVGSGGAIWVDGKVHDLDDLIDVPYFLDVKEAYAISASGVITGHAGAQSGTVAVRLTPVWPSPGDLNCDQIVSGFDLALLLGQWGRCSSSCAADLNKDGLINGIDVAMLLGMWG
jgi:hypothetical protein